MSHFHVIFSFLLAKNVEVQILISGLTSFDSALGVSTLNLKLEKRALLPLGTSSTDITQPSKTEK